MSRTPTHLGDSTSCPDLAVIAAEVREAHEQVLANVRATLEAAIRCGHLLRDAKRQVPHGGWGDWLERNFPASRRTAQAYMRVADRYANTQAPADLTLEDALRQIATPRSPEIEAPVGLTKEEAAKLMMEVKAVLDAGLFKPDVNHHVQHRAIEDEMRNMFLDGDWPEGVRGTREQNAFMFSVFCIFLDQLEKAGAHRDFGYPNFDAYARDRLKDVLVAARPIEQAMRWESSR